MSKQADDELIDFMIEIMEDAKATNYYSAKDIKPDSRRTITIMEAVTSKGQYTYYAYDKEQSNTTDSVIVCGLVYELNDTQAQRLRELISYDVVMNRLESNL